MDAANSIFIAFDKVYYKANRRLPGASQRPKAYKYQKMQRESKEKTTKVLNYCPTTEGLLCGAQSALFIRRSSSKAGSTTRHSTVVGGGGGRRRTLP